MILTQHATERLSDRILMGKEALMDLLVELVQYHGFNHPPSWWHGGKSKDVLLADFHNAPRWYPFKDVDGVDCVALLDLDRGRVVTVVKRDV